MARLIDADNLDETITRLNEQDWGITRNEYKLIDRVIFEMPTACDLEQIRAEAYQQGYDDAMKKVAELDSAYIKGFEDGKNSR